MGNRMNTSEHGRGGSTARKDGDRKENHRQGRNNKSRGHRHKDTANSCPDLLRSNANSQASRRNDDERQYEFKIYRSFSDLQDSKRSSYAEMPPIEVKVYRRSTEGLPNVGRTQSLPRGMERMSAGMMGSVGASQDLSASYYPSRPPSTCSGSGGGGGHEGVTSSNRSSRRTSVRSSLSSVAAYKVSPEEFPDVATIRRKLSEFESHFVHSLVETFQCLPPLNQLSSLSVATRPDRANQSVSLLQYFESDSVPVDLLQTPAGSRKEYFITVSPGVFSRAMVIKSAGLVDQRLGIAKEMATEMAREAAAEICRMFEYQLSLILESIALRMLAKYAVDCVYDVMKRRHRLLDRNTIVQGVVKGRPRDSLNQTGRKLISVIIGAKELKWNIFDIFKKPGLRKDLFVARDRCSGVSVNGSREVLVMGSRDELRMQGSRDESKWGSREELQTPSWRFYTSTHSEPMLYGYRGQMIEWDFFNEHYKINSDDETSFGEEVSLRYDDFHRLYCPYMWLIGLDTVQEYIGATREGPRDPQTAPSLVQFVKQSRQGCSTYIRDEVKLVYRPLRADKNIDIRLAGFTQQSTNEKALVSDAAMQVTKACDELRCRLENMAESDRTQTTTGSNGNVGRRQGNVLIHVTCPDGFSTAPVLENRTALVNTDIM